MGLVQAEDALAIVAQVEADIETGQRQPPDHFLQVIEFGFLGFEELAPGRGIEEQIAHFHRGTDRVRRRLHARRHVTAFGFDLPGLTGTGGTRGQGQARHRTDRGQGLATEAQAQYPFKVFQLADLAGGVTGQGQRQVVSRNTAAIVPHLQQFDAALLDFDIDAPGTGVQAVFQQFLGYRRRPLDNLAGGNLVGQPRAEQLDARTTTHCEANVVAGISRRWPTFSSSVFRLLMLRRLATLTW
ncbi:hypothetical protein D9M71_442580 [compost metagenome]